MARRILRSADRRKAEHFHRGFNSTVSSLAPTGEAIVEEDAVVEAVAEETAGKGKKRELPSDIESSTDQEGSKRRGLGKKRAKSRKMGKKEGMSQGRGGDASGEKCRVTMEFRQGVSGYFANGISLRVSWCSKVPTEFCQT